MAGAESDARQVKGVHGLPPAQIHQRRDRSPTYTAAMLWSRWLLSTLVDGCSVVPGPRAFASTVSDAGSAAYSVGLAAIVVGAAGAVISIRGRSRRRTPTRR